MRKNESRAYALEALDVMDSLSGGEEKKEAVREGLDYGDYLRLFMVMKPEDEITMRAMDMVECDIRLTEGNEKFRLDNCLHTVKCNIRVNSAYGYEYEITRVRGYD